MPKTPHQSLEYETFKKSLASVVSVSPAEMKQKLAQAKAEKPSPHTRYISL